jgi:solute carrier family 35 protein
LAITVLTGEVQGVMTFPDLFDPRFIAAFVTSCASAFVLNYATYLCTRVNDALTTSVVGRTKSVVQGVGGLFAFAVEIGFVNVAGLSLNSAGILWYAYEKYADERRRNAAAANQRGAPPKLAKLSDANHPHFMTRNDSQLTLSPRVQSGGFGGAELTRHARVSHNEQNGTHAR